MSIAFKPPVTRIDSLQTEREELLLKLQIIRELESCPTLVQYFSDLADADLHEIAHKDYNCDPQAVKTFMLVKRAEIGVYQFFYEMVGNKDAIIQKLQHVTTLTQSE